MFWSIFEKRESPNSFFFFFSKLCWLLGTPCRSILIWGSVFFFLQKQSLEFDGNCFESALGSCHLNSISSSSPWPRDVFLFIYTFNFSKTLFQRTHLSPPWLNWFLDYSFGWYYKWNCFFNFWGEIVHCWYIWPQLIFAWWSHTL